MNSLRLSTLSLITMMVIPIGAYAHCPGHKHCGPGGVDPEEVLYDVDITGDVSGGSESGFGWSGSGRNFGLNSPHHNAGSFTDLSFFTVALPEIPPAFTAAVGLI